MDKLVFLIDKLTPLLTPTISLPSNGRLESRFSTLLVTYALEPLSASYWQFRNSALISATMAARSVGGWRH